MIDLGNFSLTAAWMLSVFGLVAGTIGARKNNTALIRSAANSVHLCAFFAMLSLLLLAVAFVTHDYRYVYVWQNSNNAMPAMYLVSAIWGGMDGSLLLWAAIMTVFASLALFRARGVQRDLMKWVAPVLSGASGFFLLVTAFLTNPFRTVPAGRIFTDGNGLNPLLQNPSMVIHPPTLYMGFTGFVVPAAFCLAALLGGQLSDNWIRVTRRWTLVAWGFLTAGIVMGGNWAYIELGWGGFWAWDPVENASFLPWLTGTAYLHSVMVQEQKGMLKIWNVCLSVGTYLLTVFGTFLTRSGVVQSVHAFAETDVGWVFLVYIGVVAAFTVVLLWYRRVELRPEHKIESYLSREAAFLFNNLALLGICFATFWGVMFPIISEAAVGEKAVVGPPFFNQVNVPLFLALLFLMGVGPLIAWRRSSFRALKRTFLKPFLTGSVLTLLFLWVDPSRVLAAMSFGLSLFAIMTVEAEFRRAIKNRRALRAEESIPTAMVQVIRRKPRRYGGFLVHLGIAIMAVAITASSAYKIEKDITLVTGESVNVGRYNLSLADVRSDKHANYEAIVADVNVSLHESGEFLETMKPERRAYVVNEEVTTEVDLRITPREDLYLAMAGLDIQAAKAADGSHQNVDLKKTPVLLKVFINPLQMWLWFGGVVVLFGTFIVIAEGMLRPELNTARQRSDTRVPA